MENLQSWQPDILTKTSGGQAYGTYKTAQQEAASAGQKAYEQYVSPDLFAAGAKKSLFAAAPITELRGSEAKLKGQLSSVYSEYAAPDKYPEITNPLIRAKAADVRAGSLRTQVGMVQAQRQEAEGTILDWITQATAGIKAQNERLQMEWDIKKDGYQMALQEYGLVSEAEASKRADEWARKNYDMEISKYEESQRQFEETMKFSREELAVSAAKGSGGGGGTGLSELKYADEKTKSAIVDAMSALAEEDIRGQGENAIPDLKLSSTEASRAKTRINALAKAYGMDGDALYNQAWSQGGFSPWLGNQSQTATQSLSKQTGFLVSPLAQKETFLKAK